jgi:predicted DNA-binding transcriptional regulator YafY
MRRADRLFQIVQALRKRKATTARQLADRLEVSERTIYRDVQDLIASGVPIQGEAGVGYALDRSFDLPPLMFDEDEIEALVLGARVVKSWADPALAKAADSALAKVEAALPRRLKDRIESSTLFALSFRSQKAVKDKLSGLRGAIRTRHKVEFAYEDRNGQASARRVQPLGLFYWGQTWSLGAWCEMREGFREFRLDRMRELAVTDQVFQPEPGRTLADFFLMREQEETGRGSQ